MWWPRQGPILKLIDSMMDDAATLAGNAPATWPSRLPVLRLDRAYVDRGVRVLGCGVLDTVHTRHASDHLPLWVDLEPRPLHARRSSDVRPMGASGLLAPAQGG